MNTSKLKVKDIITVTLLTLINVVIFVISSFLYALPITIVLMPIFFSLLEGVVYFIIGTKIKKPGAMMIYSFVRGILGGYLPYIVLYLLAGVIAEIILKKTGYGNIKGLTASYVITQVLAGIGSTIYPYAIAAKSMAENSVSDGRRETILAASDLLVSWGAPLLVVGIIVTALIGAAIGAKIVKKHIAADSTEEQDEF
ncbi:MptD family putative ECF transporter S component [Huintestinicola sp.]